MLFKSRLASGLEVNDRWSAWLEALYLYWNWRRIVMGCEDTLKFTRCINRLFFVQTWAGVRNPFFWKVLIWLLMSKRRTPDTLRVAVWFSLMSNQNNVALDMFPFGAIRDWLNAIDYVVCARRIGIGVTATAYIAEDLWRIINSSWYQKNVLSGDLPYIDVMAHDLIKTGQLCQEKSLEFWRTHGYRKETNNERDLELVEAICCSPVESSVRKFISSLLTSTLFVRNPELIEVVNALIEEPTTLSSSWSHACRCVYYCRDYSSIECTLLSYAIGEEKINENNIIRPTGLVDLWSLYQAVQKCIVAQKDVETISVSDNLFY